ncbi:uncharacterized protein CC84DRAFT_1166884 [Paraphaeosphaeria sporulosa]|uniref:Uncharacterized protein n=1 Tax=Paraphaeosphaeria sporulosa TaxID=1460663 RepID=A0A177C6V9_9PLEO|nr:uncharacterized protein CC84DRAFT_1166884 [Paraphaeosphaeria sporulosa]OAG03136.1 hypothetical protein CC84DRAFT_1166884 [Paraphaeosphaeria sporulosa]
MRQSSTHESYEITDLTLSPVICAGEQSKQRDSGPRRVQDRSTENSDDESLLNRHAPRKIESRSTPTISKESPQSSLQPSGDLHVLEGISRNENNRNRQLPQMIACSPAKTPMTGAMPGYNLVARTIELPVKILEMDGSNGYKWRNEGTPRDLRRKLEILLLSHINDRSREQYFRAWLRNPKGCALAYAVGHRPGSIGPQPYTACDKCTGAKRPCVIMVWERGCRQLEFKLIQDFLSSGTISDVGFYVPERTASS